MGNVQYDGLRKWERRREKLIDKMAATILLHDFPKSQPKFCGGKTWPKWARLLKPIRRGRVGIGNLALKRHGPPFGELPSLRDTLVRAAGRAESRIEGRLDAFSGDLQMPLLWEYVVKRLKKKCGLRFYDPKFPDFADRLEVYILDDDYGESVCALDDQELLSDKIAELDRASFADDLLAELWARFPRQCGRLGLPVPIPQGAIATAENKATAAPPRSADPAEAMRAWELSSGYIRVKEIQQAERFQKNGSYMSRSRICEWAVQDKTLVETDPATGERCYKETWVLQRWRTWSPRKPTPHQ